MITYIIIGATVFISYLAFQNHSLMEKLQFNAAKVIHQKQYYRLLSHAFIHATWSHLFVNMFVLYFFGRGMEKYFGYYFGSKATVYFLLLYFGGILASNAWSLIKHQNNYYYNAVGASGAVSALLFAFIFFNPWEKLYFFARSCLTVSSSSGLVIPIHSSGVRKSFSEIFFELIKFDSSVGR